MLSNRGQRVHGVTLGVTLLTAGVLTGFAQTPSAPTKAPAQPPAAAPKAQAAKPPAAAVKKPAAAKVRPIDQIKKMVSLKMPEAAILNQIKSIPGGVTATADELIELKTMGASDAVIVALSGAGASPAPAAAGSTAAAAPAAPAPVVRPAWNTDLTTIQCEVPQVTRKRVIAVDEIDFGMASLFTRLAIPNRHTEATTSRPLLLHGVGRQTTHSNQTTLTITSNHAQAGPIRRALEGVSQLLQTLAHTAEQFTVEQRWRWLLRFIFRDWLKARPPDPPFLPLTALANCRI